MSRRRWTQARAVLLLAIFLSAGSSLPSLDALVYHTQADELSGSRAHVEPAGGCLNHTEHCGLARTAPGSGAVGSPANGPLVDVLSPPVPKLLVTQVQSSTHSRNVAQPRAPPVSRLV